MRALLQLKNLYHKGRLTGIPFTYGIPLPEGTVHQPSQVGLTDSHDKNVPLAVTPMSAWSDGSIRWALLDFQGTFAPSEISQWQLVLGENSPPKAPDNPVIISEDAERIRVTNGRLDASFNKKTFSIFESLKADGVEIIKPGQRCDIIALSPAGKIHRASYDHAPQTFDRRIQPAQAPMVRWDGGLLCRRRYADDRVPSETYFLQRQPVCKNRALGHLPRRTRAAA